MSTATTTGVAQTKMRPAVRSRRTNDATCVRRRPIGRRLTTEGAAIEAAAAGERVLTCRASRFPARGSRTSVEDLRDVAAGLVRGRLDARPVGQDRDEHVLQDVRVLDVDPVGRRRYEPAVLRRLSERR